MTAKTLFVKILLFILPNKLKNFFKNYLIEEMKEQQKHLDISN